MVVVLRNWKSESCGQGEVTRCEWAKARKLVLRKRGK
jgi:hypothetical protein